MLIKRSVWFGLVLLLVLLPVLTGCEAVADYLPASDAGGEVDPDAPTEIAGDEDGDGVVNEGGDGGAGSARSAETTYQRYIQDALETTVRQQTAAAELRRAYASDAVVEDSNSATLQAVRMVEDRTAITTPFDGAANANLDFDVEIVYANGDTETRVCSGLVSLRQSEGGVWHVQNPEPFPVFFSCLIK